MHSYIAILRGINVGGKNKIPMADLRAKLEKSGMKHVNTYIQSGNVVFQTEETSSLVLAEKIAKVIDDSWGFKIPVMVLKADDFADIVSANPYSSNKDIIHLHITFLSENPGKDRIKDLAETVDPPNEYLIKDTAVYLYCPNGYSKTKFNNTFLENKLKVIATTRNIKTALALQNMVQ